MNSDSDCDADEAGAGGVGLPAASSSDMPVVKPRRSRRAIKAKANASGLKDFSVSLGPLLITMHHRVPAIAGAYLLRTKKYQSHSEFVIQPNLFQHICVSNPFHSKLFQHIPTYFCFKSNLFQTFSPSCSNLGLICILILSLHHVAP